ncbi:MAG: ExbD/TolR family protein [Acidobacteriota bacterium]
MNRHRLRQRRQTSNIPTASMADIAFLLIIFFMLTTTFSPERTTVQLPGSETRTEITKDAAIIAITADGTIRFAEGEQTSILLSGPEELGALTQEIIKVFPNKQFVLKADRLVQYETIDQVLEALRNNGARNIGLLTEQERVKTV